MKLQTLLITTFALTLSFVNAEETRPVPPPQALLVPTNPANDKDPYKESTRVTPPPQFIVTEEMDDPVFTNQAGGAAPQVRLRPFEPQSSATETLSFCYEDFSLPVAMMVDMQQSKLTDAELYERLKKNLGTNPVKDSVRRETFVVIRARPGFPANAKNDATVINPDSKITSQVGYRIHLECDSMNGPMRFDLTKTLSLGKPMNLNKDKDQEKPLVNTETIDATVGLILDSPCLIGTVNRAAGSGLSSEDRILLGFVTASPVK